jgi:hypothetical protein
MSYKWSQNGDIAHNIDNVNKKTQKTNKTNKADCPCSPIETYQNVKATVPSCSNDVERHVIRYLPRNIDCRRKRQIVTFI